MRTSLLLFALVLLGCTAKPDESKMAEWKEEIIQVESDFAQMASTQGIPAAFLAFSAEDVVLMRNNKLTIGKDALRAKYTNLDPTPGTSLTWKPDFVDVSTSGDLAYTYGEYVYSQTDSLGNVSIDTGVFHTVWKRQTDGTWKFVWD